MRKNSKNAIVVDILQYHSGKMNMTTRLEQFSAALIAVGGKEEVIGDPINKKKGRLTRVLSRLGMRASKDAPAYAGGVMTDDIYDATAIVVDEVSRDSDIVDTSTMGEEMMGYGKKIHPRVESRFLVPVANRDMVDAVFRLIGIEKRDMYVQNGVPGNRWVQVSLEGDPEFRMYAGTRYLLDGAPAEGGVIGVDPDALELALTGEIPKNEA